MPRSAKAHLNYSVMQGARGNLEGRLASNDVALELAPEWPMANVYLGDTLCRLHRAPEAWPHYLRGFELGPNDQALVALGLQCLWDEHELDDDAPVRDELQDMADKHPGSWLKYIVDDTLDNGDGAQRASTRSTGRAGTTKGRRRTSSSAGVAMAGSCASCKPPACRRPTTPARTRTSEPTRASCAVAPGARTSSSSVAPA